MGRYYFAWERCPDCQAKLEGARVCPQCGLAQDGVQMDRLRYLLYEADQTLAAARAAQDARTDPSPGVAPTPEPRPRQPWPAARPSATPSTEAATERPLPTFATPAVRRPAQRSSWPALSTPTVLLGLGAVCVLVAAIVFVSVAWSDLPLSAKAAILLSVTVGVGTVAAWTLRRGLRGPAEALTLLTVALVVVDVVAAAVGDLAGLGGLSGQALSWTSATILVVAGLGWAWVALGTRTRRLTGVQVVAVLGVGWLEALVFDERWTRHEFVGLGLVLLLLAVGFVAARLSLWPFATGVVALAALTAAGVFVLSLYRVVVHDDLHGLWIRGRSVGWVACLLIAAAAAAWRRLPMGWRRGAAIVAVLGTTLLVLRPLAGSPVDAILSATAATGLAMAVLSLVLPAPWRTGAVSAAAPAAVIAAWTAAPALLTDLGRAVYPTYEAWSMALTDEPDFDTLSDVATPWVVGLAVFAIAVASFIVVTRRLPDATMAAVFGLAAAGAVGLGYATALWSIVAVAAGLAVVAGGAALARRSETLGWVCAAYAGLALVSSLGSAVTTLTVALALAVVFTVAAKLTGNPRASEGAAMAAVLSLALATAAGLSAADVADTSTAYALVGLGAVVGVSAQVRVGGDYPRGRLGLEAAADIVEAVAIAVAVFYNLDVQTPVTLTVAGASFVAVSLLSHDRRLAGVAGGLLLASASWVRLAVVGVTAVEAYTLPTALVLLVLGVVRMHRTPGASSITSLGPGLSLALLPSLWVALPDPTSLRALLLGIAAVLILLGGAVMRWVAPLAFGGGVILLLAIVNLAPYVDAVPRWVVFGLLGAALLFLGITWERRLRDARTLIAAAERLR